MRPFLHEISKTLYAVVGLYSRVFIVVDALDECHTNSGCLANVLAELLCLQTKYRANVFTTSRFIPEITETLANFVSLEIRASEHDVGKYLDGHMSHLPRFVQQSEELRNEIKTKIVKAIDGMYGT